MPQQLISQFQIGIPFRYGQPLSVQFRSPCIHSPVLTEAAIMQACERHHDRFGNGLSAKCLQIQTVCRRTVSDNQSDIRLQKIYDTIIWFQSPAPYNGVSCSQIRQRVNRRFGERQHLCHGYRHYSLIIYRKPVPVDKTPGLLGIFHPPDIRPHIVKIHNVGKGIYHIRDFP